MTMRTGIFNRTAHQMRATMLLPLLLAGAISPAAQADATSDSANAGSGNEQLGEIVVTAERRETDIQKTPLAISVVSAQSLDKSFVNDVSGLNSTVPSFQATKTSGFENIVTIRGVGSETPEEAPTTVPGVSLFLDGVYVSNTVSLDQTLFDIDHIEVLRGPQGALYGQSSTGGVINVVTKKPVLDQFSGYGDFSVGNYKLTRERAELNLPMGETLAFRVSAQRYDHEGFTTVTRFPVSARTMPTTPAPRPHCCGSRSTISPPPLPGSGTTLAITARRRRTSTIQTRTRGRSRRTTRRTSSSPPRCTI